MGLGESRDGATLCRSRSNPVIANCRRTASRTNALLLVPVRAAISRSSASSLSSMRTASVVRYKVLHSASPIPAFVDRGALVGVASAAVGRAGRMALLLVVPVCRL